MTPFDSPAHLILAMMLAVLGGFSAQGPADAVFRGAVVWILVSLLYYVQMG